MTIICGDCLDVMKTFPGNHFSGIVTDPPYGLSFMGKDWDHGIPGVPFWEEALRVCKPGSFILAFGGTRTYHRLTCAIEDAGWEIRDCIMYIYGSGFPKSHNFGCKCKGNQDSQDRRGQTCEICKGIIGLEGYGTALKPAYEPIIMAMKPLDGTFKQNAEKWGQAGININECRIEFSSKKESYRHSKEWVRKWTNSPIHAFDKEMGNHPGQKREVCEQPNSVSGRWPANIIFDEEAGRVLDEQSGSLTSGKLDRSKIKAENNIFGQRPKEMVGEYLPNSGGASRFFYCAKASKSERGDQNIHPTVKPLKLMEYLLKLISPPENALILDPFAGSGTTILAAKRLGIAAIGIEKNEEYADIATHRINTAGQGNSSSEEEQLSLAIF